MKEGRRVTSLREVVDHTNHPNHTNQPHGSHDFFV
jgi:hypothetical protein